MKLLKYGVLSAVMFGVVIAMSLSTAFADVPFTEKGKLHRRNYNRAAKMLYTKRGRKGISRKTLSLNKAAVRLAKAIRVPGTRVHVVGQSKDDLLPGFIWDRKDDAIELIVFINAADPLGVFIKNLRRGDQVQIKSATGIATFSDRKKTKETLSSFIGIAAKAGALAAPEAAPAIGAAEQAAKALFGFFPDKGKLRDAYGQDPGSGHWAKKEGGVVVCMPAAQGVYYTSGGKIKKHRPRTDDIRPDHVKHGGFLARSNPRVMNRTAITSGELFLAPWDHKFEDNEGFYQVHLVIRKGRPSTPPVVFSSSGRRNRRTSPIQLTPTRRVPLQKRR